MSVRTRIEWWTGQKLGYETADELGIGEFTLGNRPIWEYLKYARVKAKRRAKWKPPYPSGDRVFNFHRRQRFKGKRGVAVLRTQGYPNLRKAWANRHRNALRRKAEKALEARREAIRRDLERYGL